MIKRTLILLMVFSALGVTSCRKDDSPKKNEEDLKYREIALAYIGDYGRGILTSDWKKAPISTGKYLDHEVVYVTFNMRTAAGPGLMIVWIYRSSKKAFSIETRF